MARRGLPEGLSEANPHNHTERAHEGCYEAPTASWRALAAGGWYAVAKQAPPGR
nr:MAG TPA: hypothetical protein [Caudoviricetes sp.]